MKRRLRQAWKLIEETANKSGQDYIFSHAAAIGFYTIFSLAPLFVLFLSIGGFLLEDAVIRNRLMQIAGRFLDPSLIDTLNQYAQTQLTSGEPIISLSISIIVLIFGATTVINQFKITLNRIWNVEEVKIHSVSFYLYSRLKSFSIMIIMLALLITSVLLEGILSFLTGFFGQIIPNIDLYLGLSRLLTIAFSILSFAILFKYLPDVRAPWRDIFVGASITAGLFIAGKYAIGAYFSAFDIATAFKAAGSLIVFLVWIYYSSAIILIGAVFTQVYTRQFGGEIEPYRYVSFSKKPKKSD